MTQARTGLAERLVTAVAERTGRLRRRSFLGGAALMGAALAVDPFGYLTRPASAYDAVCGADNTCAAGYTVFCCTINGGNNSCPPDSFIGGWWKADNSSFCGGNARYYIDCNAYRDGRYTCHCNTTTCDQRRVACNQFRYGQCNTQIPWSNTGPVLCRVVSCTPPWVQYGGTCSSASATDNNTATHSAPCLTGQRPVGVVDQISSTGNTVHISGWCYDPDSPSTSLNVAIYQDGRGLMGIHANQPRPDVNSARHITGNHGFSVSFTASSGHHTYTVFAMNIGGGSGNPQIGGRTIIVNPGVPPIGHMDRCDPYAGGMVISGWAFDRDVPSTSIEVAIYQDNKPVLRLHTDQLRPDVNSAYHITGNHGFTASFAAPPGAHNYKVYALNAAGGSGNPLIGNHSTVVPGTANAAPAAYRSTMPAGKLESVAVSGNSVRLVGWAADPSRPAEQLPIVVVEDGAVLHRYATGIARPDLADDARSGFAEAGRYGFDITIPAGTGLHSYSVHVLDPAYGMDESLLGEQTVRVNQDGPIGRLDLLQRLGDTVRLTGWAYDPDRPTAQLVVSVYRDGAPLAEYRTGLPCPQLAGTDGALGLPGFEISIPDLAGPHSYTVYARGSGAARQVLLGGRTLPADSAQEVAV